MPGRVAVAFTEEALRAMQDAFQIHKTVRCAHAREPALEGVHKESAVGCLEHHLQHRKSNACCSCLAHHTALDHQMGLAVDVLVC